MGQSSSLPAPDAASLTDWLQNGDGHLRGLWMGGRAQADARRRQKTTAFRSFGRFRKPSIGGTPGPVQWPSGVNFYFEIT